MADISKDPKYRGLLSVLDPNNKYEQPAAGAIQDDIEGEQETIPNSDSAPISIPGLMKTLAEASKGVSEKTDGEYHRYVNILTNVIQVFHITGLLFNARNF